MAQTWQVATRRQQEADPTPHHCTTCTANRVVRCRMKNWVIGFRVALDLNSSATTTTDEDVKVYPDDQHSMPKPNVPITKGMPNHGLGGHLNQLHRFNADMLTYPVRLWKLLCLPFARHNHEPTIASCPNGQLYASWFSTNCGEPGRCVGLVHHGSQMLQTPMQSGRQLRLS